MALGLGRELYSMCWGAGSGSARQGPSVSLSSPGAIGGLKVPVCAYARMRVSDAGGRTAERALDWRCGT